MSHALNPKEIDVLILCGGLGKRLRGVVNDKPKPLADINSRPFLDILIDYVASYGFRRFILCIGYMGDVIKQHYQTRESSLTILFSEEREPLGTGGAIKNAEPLIQSNPFLAMNGDSFCPFDLCAFLDFHTSKGALLSIALVRAEETQDYGVIALGESQRIISFDEKKDRSWSLSQVGAGLCPSPSFINAGIYLFDSHILSLMPARKAFSLEYNLFPKVINREFYGYVISETLIDIGTPKRYEKAKQNLVGVPKT